MTPFEHVSIVVPAFQEESTIRTAVERLLTTLEAHLNSFEIIVVLYGCTDATEERVREIGDHRIRLISYSTNQGKGFALKTGFCVSVGDVVCFFDADLDIDPSTLVDLLNLLQKKDVDCVVGSKSHVDSVVDYPFLRRAQSNVFKLIVFFLFRLKIRDTQTGAKVFRREVLESVLPICQMRGFSFDLEMLARAAKCDYKIVEGPVILNYQFSSTIGVLVPLRMFLDALKIRARLLKG